MLFPMPKVYDNISVTIKLVWDQCYLLIRTYFNKRLDRTKTSCRVVSSTIMIKICETHAEVRSSEAALGK